MATLVRERLTVITAPKASHVLRGAASNWGRYAFSAGLAFFLAPYVVWHLGNSAYGVWCLIVSLTGLSGSVRLGSSRSRNALRGTLPRAGGPQPVYRSILGSDG